MRRQKIRSRQREDNRVKRVHSEDESEACQVIKKSKTGKRPVEDSGGQDADEALEEFRENCRGEKKSI